VVVVIEENAILHLETANAQTDGLDLHALTKAEKSTPPTEPPLPDKPNAQFAHTRRKNVVAPHVEHATDTVDSANASLDTREVPAVDMVTVQRP